MDSRTLKGWKFLLPHYIYYMFLIYFFILLSLCICIVGPNDLKIMQLHFQMEALYPEFSTLLVMIAFP